MHAVYNLPHGLWLAVSAWESVGGATRIAGGDKFAPEANNRVGTNVALPIPDRYYIKSAATTGLSATEGNDFSTLGVAWQVIF